MGFLVSYIHKKTILHILISWMKYQLKLELVLRLLLVLPVFQEDPMF